MGLKRLAITPVKREEFQRFLEAHLKPSTFRAMNEAKEKWGIIFEIQNINWIVVRGEFENEKAIPLTPEVILDHITPTEQKGNFGG